MCGDAVRIGGTKRTSTVDRGLGAGDVPHGRPRRLPITRLARPPLCCRAPGEDFPPRDETMTPLVMLMMAASTAADPAPVFQGPATPLPSYSSAAAPV